MKRIAAIGLAVAFVVMMSVLAYTGETKPEKESATLEGILKVHPKFLYKYYIAAYGGQTCALYGKERAQECAELKDIEAGTYIRVRGRLGTFLHKGGTKDDPSPFGRTWVIYMEVEEVTRLKEGSCSPAPTTDSIFKEAEHRMVEELRQALNAQVTVMQEFVQAVEGAKSKEEIISALDTLRVGQAKREFAHRQLGEKYSADQIKQAGKQLRALMVKHKAVITRFIEILQDLKYGEQYANDSSIQGAIRAVEKVGPQIPRRGPPQQAD